VPRNALALAKRLQLALDRLEPALRRSVLRALTRLQQKVSASDLVAAIQSADEFQLRVLVRGLGKDMATAAGTVTKAFQLGSKAAVAQLPEGIAARLDLANPFVVRAAEESAARLVTAVSADTKSAIRAIVKRSVAGEVSGRQAAQLIKPLIGLTERQALAVINRRAKLLKGGMSISRVNADATKYAAKLLKQRSEMIARTEIIRASSDGQIETWKQARQQGFLGQNARKKWLTTQDDRLCPQCAPLNGVSVPLDGLFLGQVAGPPLHPACRCSLTVVAAGAVRRAVA
jgi:SPP1 gp7 family putative phage head morphogenesis protein